MKVRFLRDWTQVYQKGSEAEIGDSGLTQGQFIELHHRGMVEVIEEEAPQYRTAVAAAPKRKRGRPRKADR